MDSFMYVNCAGGCMSYEEEDISNVQEFALKWHVLCG